MGYVCIGEISCIGVSVARILCICITHLHYAFHCSDHTTSLSLLLPSLPLSAPRLSSDPCLFVSSLVCLGALTPQIPRQWAEQICHVALFWNISRDCCVLALVMHRLCCVASLLCVCYVPSVDYSMARESQSGIEYNNDPSRVRAIDILNYLKNLRLDLFLDTQQLLHLLPLPLGL